MVRSMTAEEDLSAVVDNYTAEMTLATTDEGAHESWGFIWHGAYVRALVNRLTPSIQVLTFHTPEDKAKIVAFVSRMIKRGNDPDDTDED
jgi:hypothetical protein